MGENSKIEWTDHTFNPWRGCTKVSAGCANCYAETLSGRNPAVLGEWGPKGTRVIASESAWREPLKWDRAAAKEGKRARVFCASLADVFEGRETMPAEAWPEVEKARLRLFGLILDTPNLDWLILTKRPENAVIFVGDSYMPGRIWDYRIAVGHELLTAREIRLREEEWPPQNVLWGTSVENQATADERIPHLLKIPGRRFLSMEPLLEPVDLSEICDGHQSCLNPECWGDCDCDSLYGYDPGCRRHGGDGRLTRRIDWVIVGGESGPNARPMHPDWVRSIRDQCQAAGVPFFFKQWGEWDTGAVNHQVRNAAPPGTFSSWETVSSTDRKRVGEFTFHAEHADGTFTPMRKVGKKQAGRLLDGREWNELPEGL